MVTAERRAEVTWQGTLEHGRGEVRLNSGATGVLPVTWASRTERSQGMTSPEELIAAAHASCFSMGLSHGLTQAGTPPERLNVAATCTLTQTEQGFRITGVHLDVEGVVPGLDEDGFVKAAEAAKDGCPVSLALKGNLEISLTARLA
jgi:osmotically inducible protein OsmC